MRDGILARRPLTLALLLLLALALGAQVASGALTWTEQQVTDDIEENEDSASIWGDKLVVREFEGTYVHDLTTGARSLITTGSTYGGARIYGDRVVWVDDVGFGKEIWTHDLSSGQTVQLTNDSINKKHHEIHGNNIVWAQDDGATEWNVWRYNTVTGVSSVVANDPDRQEYCDIFGESVVYESYDTTLGGGAVRITSLIDGSTTAVNGIEEQYDPRIWGDTVAWYDYRTPGEPDVWYYDIATGAETQLTNDSANEHDYPVVFRDKIAYGSDLDGSSLFVDDLSDNSTSKVTDSIGVRPYAAFWGNKIAWEDKRVGAYTDVYLAHSDLEADRSGGATRYDTSAQASAAHFSSAKTVVIATGTGFADALAASGLAGCYGGPLILTSGNSLSPAAEAEIDRLGATDAVIIGGVGAVSEAVEDELENDMGLNVTRIGGANRYATSALIAAEIESMTGTGFEKTAFIARGDSFPDALAVSPLAYYNRFPILLTRTTGLPAETAKALSDLDIEDAVIAGGEGAVGSVAKTALDAALATNGGSASLRWGGATRYETSVIVAEEACKKHWAGRGFVGLAVGNNFPDALSGGAAAGREFGVLLLTQSTSLPQPAKDFMTDAGDGVGWVEAFGGTGVVSDAVANEAAALTGQ